MGMFDLDFGEEREYKRKKTKDYYERTYGQKKDNANNFRSRLKREAGVIAEAAGRRVKGNVKKAVKAYGQGSLKKLTRPRAKLGKPSQFRKSYKPRVGYSDFFEL